LWYFLSDGSQGKSSGNLIESSPMATLSRSNCLEPVDVFVLAGGLGTRIRPALGDLPKLLAPVRGGTYLDGLLNWLRSFGARRVVLGLGYQAQAVVDHLRKHPAKGLTVETMIEPQPLGTAGAIRFARAQLHSDPVMVLNGDTMADADLCAFLESHRTRGFRGSVLCAEVDDAARYGRVLVDGRGMIDSFAEKDPAFRGRALINAGVYLMSAALLDEIAAGTAASLERDFFERLPKGSLAAFAGCNHFIDIGTPESLAVANQAGS
jgi:NDP-sugar pyrophosphorylase family protein